MSQFGLLVCAWVLVPALTVLIFLGLGRLLLWRSVGPAKAPAVLIGFPAFVVLSWLLAASSATAELLVPSAAVAVVGGVYALWKSGRSVAGPGLAAGLLAYLCYAAPAVISGKPTWAGWVKLDDNATMLAITDRLLDAGRSPIPAPSSTYELAVLGISGGFSNAPVLNSYPSGSFTPLGIGSALSGVDAAWLFQPYMAMVGALLAVGIFFILGSLTQATWPRLAFGVVAAQAATLYGYYLWGGFKEASLAGLLICVAVAAGLVLQSAGEWKRWPLLLLACVAFLTASGTSGLPYVLVPIAGVLVIVAYRSESRYFEWLRRYRLPLALLVALLVLAAAFLPEIPGASRLSVRIPDIGNLIYPLEPAQLFGVWPVGDFRLVPERTGLVGIVIAFVLVLAIAGTVGLIRKGSWALPLVTLPAVMVVGRAFTDDQAWLAGKAMAVASPFVLASAFAGALYLWGLSSELRPGREAARSALRVATGLGAVAMVAGVLASNALAYREVWLAPFEAHRELEKIGDEFSGQGPALMASGNVYGTRHFLRSLAAESPDELRTRQLALRTPDTAPGDITALQDRELDPFQLIVTKRSPSASVPPPPFLLAYRGRFYDVWRRDPFAPVTDELLPLGSDTEGGAVADCGKVEELAARAKPGAELAYAERARNATIPLNPLPGGPDWPPGKLPGSILPVGGGSVVRTFTTSRFGTYSLWMLGSFPGRLTVELDGRRLFRGSSILAPGDGDAFPLGSEKLSAGSHRLTITYSKPRLLPGSDARVAVADRISGQRLNTDPPSGLPSLGPVVVQPGTPETPGVKTVPLEQAGTLCGRRLDWVASVSRP